MFSTYLLRSAILSILVGQVNTQITPSPTAPAGVAATTTSTAQTTAITGCHMHGATQYVHKLNTLSNSSANNYTGIV